MRAGKKRKLLGVLAVLGMLALAGVWLSQPDRFTLPGFSARFYARLGDLCRRAGFMKVAIEFFQRADLAQERHLQWGVRSKRLACVTFARPDLVDAGQVAHQILALAKRHGFTVFAMRQVASAASGMVFEVYVEPSGEQQVRDFVESPELQASPFE